MTITTDDVRKFATNSKMRTFANLFDEWLESHDSEVRIDAIIARDTRTPAELLQAAWEAAYPVPEERDASSIPADARVIWRMGIGHDYDVYVGIAGDMSADLPQMIAHGTVRTLDPLPPLIPKGTPAVWASTSDGILVRRILVNTDHITRQWIDMFDTKYTDEQLINPVPIPKEER